MYGRKKKPKANDDYSVATNKSRVKPGSESAFQIIDNRPEAAVKSKLQRLANDKFSFQSVDENDAKSPVGSSVIQGVFLQNYLNRLQWKDTEDGAMYTQVDVINEHKIKLKGKDGQTFFILRDANSEFWNRRSTEPLEFEEGYNLAEKHLAFFKNNLPKFGQQNKYTWIRRITGGGSGTLTGKRNADGIKTDMSDDEYQAIVDISNGFYDTSEELDSKIPRNGYIRLYRGFTIPKIEYREIPALITQMQKYIDVLPSSASWMQEPAIDMSIPGVAEDSVLVHLLIPPEHPIVILSYPDNKNPTAESKPKALDLAQAEVMIGASTQKNVKIIHKAKLKGGNTRYHVSAELEPMSKSTVINAANRAREIATKLRVKKQLIDIAYSDLATRFAHTVAASITEASVGQTFSDKFGNLLKLRIFDTGPFGCTFEVL